MRDQPSHGNSRALHALLYVVMVVLLVYAIVFFKLRIFSDAAIIILDMLRLHGFGIAHARFVADINQLLPLGLATVHAPLKDVLLAYSVNHELVPIACALLCMYWLRRPYHALAILLLCVLMAVLLFYYPVSELQTGLILLLLYDALAEEAVEGRKVKAFYALGLVLLPVIVFAHPMAIVSLMGWLAFRLLKPRRKLSQIAFIAGVIFLTIAVKMLWFVSYYETNKLMSWDMARAYGLNYYVGPFARSWYKYLVQDAFPVPILFVVTIGLLWRLRNFRLLALLLLFSIGAFTLVLLNFENWNGAVYDHYYEHQMQPIIFFMLLILCDALSRSKLPKGLPVAAFALVFAISFIKVGQGKDFHEERQKWMAGYMHLMDRMQIKKAVVGRNWIREDMIRSTYWSGAQESLLLSAIDGPTHAKTLYPAWDPKHIQEPAQAGNMFVGDARFFPIDQLPKYYFQLDKKPYVILDNVVPDSVLNSLYWPQTSSY